MTVVDDGFVDGVGTVVVDLVAAAANCDDLIDFIRLIVFNFCSVVFRKLLLFGRTLFGVAVAACVGTDGGGSRAFCRSEPIRGAQNAFDLYELNVLWLLALFEKELLWYSLAIFVVIKIDW